MKVWNNEAPFPELSHRSNNLKAIAREKSLMNGTKDLCGHSNPVVDANKWA